MSRKIKFRAWAERFKKMYDVKIIDFIKEKVYFDEDTYRHFNDIELMQFTGLYDKNGKEIYEGDIIKFEDYNINGTKEFFNIGVIKRCGVRDEIEISQLLYEETYFTENYMDFIDGTFENSIVIGNIYENPELLGDDE